MRVTTTHIWHWFIVASTIVLILVSAILIAALSVSRSPQAAAADARDFKPGLIISDPVFTDKSSMTISRIQSFLNSKVPSCDTNGLQASEMNNSGVPDYNNNGSIQRWEWGKYKYNQTTFPCLKDYQQNGKSAAQIIYDVAQEFSINPQVLIVLLQKEQTLVTDTWPLTIQYRSATGYGCPDDEPCNSEYYGLTNQLRWAGRMFRAIMNDSPTWYTPYELGNEQVPWHPDTGRCGYSTVNIQNRATQALYNYTPYRPNQAALNAGYGQGNTCSSYGNRNFFLYFTDWFGSTQRMNNIRLVTCSGTRYMIERGVAMKREITASGMAAWQFPEEYFVADDSSCSYPSYSTALSRLVRSRDSRKAYLVDNGRTYLLNNQSVATAWGLGDINSTTIPELDGKSINDNLSTGRILSRIVTSMNPDLTTVYLIDNAKRYKISGTDAGDTYVLRLIRGADSSEPYEMSVALLQSLPNDQSLDFMFRIGSAWYIFDYGTLKQIGNPSAWSAFVNGPELTANILEMFSDRKTLTSGFFSRKDSRYYRVMSGTDTMNRTPDRSVAQVWGIQDEPSVTKMLTDRLLILTETITDSYAMPGALRLIQCNDTKYLIERNVKAKRPLADNIPDAWGFTNMHFFEGDRGCSYSTYSLEVNRLIRSRESKKVYYLANQKAYLVHSRAAAEAWGFGNTSAQTYPLVKGQTIKDTFPIVKQLPAAS